jgi:protein-disulfide isomerase
LFSIVGAIALAGALPLAGCGSSSKPDGSIDLSGIPQKGVELGNPSAKVTLIEITDPQCPFCARYATATLPILIDKYVRTNKMRVEYRGIAVIGQDSGRLLRLAYAAGLQNKLWNVVELEFERQGFENSGYATDAFLRSIAESVSGLDSKKALAQADTNAVVPMIDAAVALTRKAQGNEYGTTPWFLISSTGSKQAQVIIGAQPLSTFESAIDAELKK